VHYTWDSFAQLQEMVSDGVDYILTMHHEYIDQVIDPTPDPEPAKLQLARNPTNNALAISWHHQWPYDHRLQASSDLVHWTDVASNYEVTGPPWNVTCQVPILPGRDSVFRLQYEPVRWRGFGTGGGPSPGGMDDGLQLYLPFSEGMGATTADLSSNLFTGSFSGNVDWAEGWDGTGIHLTSSGGDGVALSDPRAVSGLSNLTLACWFKPDLAHQGMLLAKHNFGTDGEWFLRMDSASQLSFTTINADLQRVDQTVSTPTNLVDGQWHLAVATYDGAAMKLYLDGTLLGATNQTGVLNRSSGSLVRIGAFENPYLMQFQGGIDEVRIWGRALSQDEIVALLQPGGLDQGLQLYFPFAEGFGTTTADPSAHRFRGELSDNVDWAEGRLGTGLHFTGGSGGGLALSDPSSLSGLSNLTLSCWFRPDLAHQGMLLAKHNFGTDGEWFLRMDSETQLSFTTINANQQRVDQTVTTSTSLTDGHWHLAVATYDGAAMRVYLDGLLLGSTNQSAALNRSSGSTVRVGAFENPALMEFQGGIDEVRIWNRALAQDEISALSQPVAIKDGLQLYFPFWEGSGGATADLSPNRFSGVFSSNADWAPGRFGTGIQLTNSAGTGLALPNTWSLSGLSNLTLSCWFKPDVSHQGMLLAKHNFGTDGEWFLRMDSGSQLSFTTINADLQRIDQTVTTSTNLTDGQWHLAAATYDGATMNLYVDGSLLGSTNQTGALNRSLGSHVRVGAFENPGLMQFQGRIDEVKIWDRTLGPDEITSLWMSE